MPAYWDIASNIIIRFAKRFGGKGYDIIREGLPDINIRQVVFADDNLAPGTSKEDLTETVQAILIIQAVMNIRSQASKSIICLTSEAIKHLNQIIHKWKSDKQNAPETHTNIEQLKVKPHPGRWWTHHEEGQQVPYSYPVTVTYSPTTTTTITKTITREYTTPNGRRRNATDWGITIQQKNEYPAIISLDLSRAQSAMSHTENKNDEGECPFRVGDTITEIKPIGITHDKRSFEEILLDNTLPALSIKVKRPTPWKINSEHHPETHVDERTARIIVATHEITTIEVVTLNQNGVIAKARIPSLLPDKITNREGKEILTNDTTKYLGIIYSASQGDSPHNDSILNRLHTKSSNAASMASSLAEFVKLSNTVLSFINYDLSSTITSQKELNVMRIALSRAAFSKIGLTCPSNSADRQTMIAISTPAVSLGMGLPDIRTMETYQASRSLLKAAMSPHPTHRATLLITIEDTIDSRGCLKTTTRNDPRTRHTIIGLTLLRELGITVHAGPNMPHVYLSEIPPSKPYPVTRENNWLVEQNPQKLHLLAQIMFLPTTMIAYLPYTQTDASRFTPRRCHIRSMIGSLDIFAAINMARSTVPPHTHIYIIDIRNIDITQLFTKTFQKTSHLNKRVLNKYAIDQAIRFEDDAQRRSILGSIQLQKLKQPEHPIQPPKENTGNPDTWTRRILPKQMSEENLRYLACTAKIIKKILNESNDGSAPQQPPTKPQPFYPKLQKEADFILSVDASVNPEPPKAPDFIIKEYFHIKKSRETETDKTTKRIPFHTIMRNDLTETEQLIESSDQILIWLLFPPPYDLEPPCPSMMSKTPRWILSTAMKHHRSNGYKIAPMHLKIFFLITDSENTLTNHPPVTSTQSEA